MESRDWSSDVCSSDLLLTYLQSSIASIGQTTASESRFTDTTSPLVTATPSFTGSWRDAFFGTAVGAVSSASEYGKLVTASAFGDQPFDLYIEVSENQTAISRWHNVSATGLERFTARSCKSSLYSDIGVCMLLKQAPTRRISDCLAKWRPRNGYQN